MKVLVTGAAGFIGRHMTSFLKSRGHQVLTVDLSRGDLQGDLTDEQFVFNALGKSDFDAVVHLAALADVKKSIEEMHRCFKINVFGTLNMLELSLRNQISRFVYMSTANVYGVPKQLPVKENALLNPRTPYDQSKAMADRLVASYHQHKKLPAVILRSWKAFGEGDYPSTAVMRFISACLKDEPIPLYNGGKDTTDPYHVSNLCHAVELSLKKDDAVGEVFNLGIGQQVSIRELAVRIKRLTDSRSKLKNLPPRTEAEKLPLRSYPSIEKIRKRLGYKPILGLDEGLRRTIEWVRAEIK